MIKFLKSPYSHADVQRFSLEVSRMQTAQVTARGGIAKVLEYNLAHTPPFYVEEYFPDGTLAKKMRDIFANGNVFLPGAAVGYCRQILNCLQGIHNSGQIHRDVKPPNIMYRAATKQLVLNDMGLGRTIERPTNLQTRYFKGTPGYSAPEQETLSGVDHRADLYAVGVILHEMLTGHRASWNAMSYTADARVAALVRWLLAFDRNRRPATAAHAVAHINALGIATR